VQVVLEILLYIVCEILAYWTGRLFAPILLPHLKIDPFRRQKSTPYGWKWRGFTYRKGKHRYLYTESLQALGVAVWMMVALVAFVLYWW
jgi:hypothetical protein